MPCITLTLAYFGEYALVMRSSLLDTMREDYLTLRARKGSATSRCETATRCATRCSSTTLIAINFGYILSGVIAVETVFSWPARPRDLRGAARARSPMLQGLFLVFSAAVIFFNLMADLLYPILDPRVRYA